MTLQEQLNKMNFAIGSEYELMNNADTNEECDYHSDRIDEMEEHRVEIMDAMSLS